jgi:hypothetical protein
MTRGLARIVVAVAMLAGFVACTLVDGVSDLQGGRKPGSSDGGNASVPSDGAARDARATSDAGGAAVTCGAALCPTDQGCCLPAGAGAKRCTTHAECTAATDYFLTCTSAKTCPTSAPVCCFDFADEQATCAGQCGADQYELCESPETTPCTAGKACVGTVPGTTLQAVCQ